MGCTSISVITLFFFLNPIYFTVQAKILLRCKLHTSLFYIIRNCCSCHRYRLIFFLHYILFDCKLHANRNLFS